MRKIHIFARFGGITKDYFAARNDFAIKRAVHKIAVNKAACGRLVYGQFIYPAVKRELTAADTIGRKKQRITEQIYVSPPVFFVFRRAKCFNLHFFVIQSEARSAIYRRKFRNYIAAFQRFIAQRTNVFSH